MWAYWHGNGKKSTSGNDRKGERNGTWQFWSDTGQLAKIMSYKNGKGRPVEFYKYQEKKVTFTNRVVQ